MRKLYFLATTFSIAFLGLFYNVQAQSVSGVQVQIVEDDLQITYTMSGLRDGQKFDVELYSSLDSYAAPLTDERITGSLGQDIVLSSGNQITIAEPLETLGAITGDLNFKIRATLIYNPVSIVDPATFFAVKRLKSFEPVWTGGLGGEQVKFDLYRNNELILDDFHSTVNNRSTEFKFPKVDLGTGYTMMMQFESLNQDIALPDFEVKRKKSIAGRVVKWLLLAAAVDFALYASSGDQVPYEEVGGFIFKEFDPLTIIDNSLPEPPTGLPVGIAPITILSF